MTNFNILRSRFVQFAVATAFFLAAVLAQTPLLPLIKMLRGLPGDRFWISGEHLYLNGALVVNSAGEPFELTPASMTMLSIYAEDYTATIPPDTYLVLGDNREGSLDSTRFGLIARAAIIGRVIDR